MLKGIDSQAALSTFPIVGPVIGAYNIAWSKFAARATLTSMMISEAIASAAYAEDNEEAGSDEAEAFEKRRIELIEIQEEELVYTKAALLGNLGNLIGTIVLIALGVFTGVWATIVATSLTLGSIAYAYNIHHLRTELNRRADRPLAWC